MTSYLTPRNGIPPVAQNCNRNSPLRSTQNPTDLHCILNSLPSVHILRQINVVHSLWPYLLKICSILFSHPCVCFFKLSLSVFPPNVRMQDSPTCSICKAYLIFLDMIIQIIFHNNFGDVTASVSTLLILQRIQNH